MDAMAFYYSMFALSLLIVAIYAFVFHKHFDVNLTIMTTLVPIINMAFVLMGNASIIEEALIALRITYLGGCFVLLAAMFLIFNICGINLKPWMRVLFVLLSTGVYVTTLTIGHYDIFYVGIPKLDFAYGAAFITDKHYGFMHTIFYILIGFYYVITMVAVIYSFFKKKQVSRTILFLILLAISVSVIGFFGSRLITHSIELLPATYNIGMIIYLVIASRLRLYDASDSVIDSLVQKGETGFISFDNKMRFLGSNETAKKMLPELSSLVVDRPIKDKWLNDNFLPLVKEYDLDHSKDKHLLSKEDRIYLVHINPLKFGIFHVGYQFLVSDDTANQQYISLITNYNSKLEEEVKEKTKHILEMHDKLVLSMATMVEGRDNSTGGHIKRTSDCIRILVEEMRKDHFLNQEDRFFDALIKAAPMHDLGKIAVDDAILRKPGRYTPEEYEVMKTHAAEGAKIVKKILEDDEDNKYFAEIAVNVAHYHHERYDGTGYPDKLKGDDIPLEARIMAVADVYDALISKRTYKEKYSYEETNRIILEGMGTQFDKRLEPYYQKARERLEEYYRNIDC